MAKPYCHCRLRWLSSAAHPSEAYGSVQVSMLESELSFAAMVGKAKWHQPVKCPSIADWHHVANAALETKSRDLHHMSGSLPLTDCSSFGNNREARPLEAFQELPDQELGQSVATSVLD